MPPQEEKGKDQRSTEERIADLETRLARAQSALPLTTTPEHSAGPGLEVADTWSLYDQEQATAVVPEPTVRQRAL